MCAHAAACVSGSLLVIVGGENIKRNAISDFWVYDFTATTWRKVFATVVNYEIHAGLL